MLIINGKKFAETEKEFTESLFCSGGTCHGYAKRNKRSITLTDHQKKEIVKINRFGVFCGVSTFTDDTGKTKNWYSYCVPDFINQMKLSKMREIVESLYVKREYNWTHGDYENWFK